MQSWDKDIKAFICLVKAGLRESEVRLLPFEGVNYAQVHRLAQEQSVVGLVAAGLEHVQDVKIPKDVALSYAGVTLQFEHRNKAMNEYMAKLIQQLRDAGVYALLVKGQGIAQCYERPLWRASGDIDLLLDAENYEMAKIELLPKANNFEEEDLISKHQALSIGNFVIELHGRLPFMISKRVDRVIDAVLKDSLTDGGACVWNNGGTDVCLPKPDNHIIIVFTHFLHHFFIEGVGLRQICDWCRMLWTYRDSISVPLLEKRLTDMGLMSEWRVFAALAVDYLGMPRDAMPFYVDSGCYGRKARRALRRILECGNMGHNHDLRYRRRYSGVAYLVVAFWRRFWEFLRLSIIFPLDAPRFFGGYLGYKVKK